MRRGIGDLAHGIQGECPAWCLGGEKKQLVQLLRHHGLEQREQGTKGFANAGAGLGHQATAGAHRFVQGFSQLPLALSELWVGETQRQQALVTVGQASLLRSGPAQKALALGFEEGLQLGSRTVLREQRLAVAVHVEVHQRHLDGRQLSCLAHQPAIDLGLCPVQLTVIGRLTRQIATVRLDLFQAIAARVIAIGAAPHPEGFELAFKGDFRLVASSPPCHHPLMPFDTLLGGGRWREAQVQVADLGAELTQGAHRYAVAQGVSLQRTWHTATGRPCCLQNSSQRS
ncbi:hypothetical protein D3C80_882540 [compost metagenome]